MLEHFVLQQSPQAATRIGFHRLLIRFLIYAAPLWSAFFAANATADIADRNWRLFQRADVELYTDINAKTALELLQKLERFEVRVDRFVQPFAELSRAAAPVPYRRAARATDDGGLRVLVMARRKDFARLFKPSHFAAFTLPTLQRTTLVVGPMVERSSLRENLFHEYVHYRLRRDVLGGLPLWFEEGLAAYLSQTEFVTRNSTRQKKHRVEAPRSEAAWRLGDVVARRNLTGLSRSEVRRFYESAHALVRYLFSHSKYAHKKFEISALTKSLLLGDFQAFAGAGVDLGKAERAMHVDSALFGSPSAATTTRQTTELHTILESASSTIGSEKLPALEVRRVLAEAALEINPGAAARLYSTAVKAQPEAVWPRLGEARAWRLLGKLERAENSLAAAQMLAPDSALVLTERAASTTSGCIVAPAERCDAAWQSAVRDLRLALDVDPNSLDASYRLGIAYLHAGQPVDALTYLQVAWTRAPWSPRISYFLGESLRLAGDGRAYWYLRNAQRLAVSPYYLKVSETAINKVDIKEAALPPLPDDRDKLLE